MSWSARWCPSACSLNTLPPPAISRPSDLAQLVIVVDDGATLSAPQLSHLGSTKLCSTLLLLYYAVDYGQVGTHTERQWRLSVCTALVATAAVSACAMDPVD